MKMQYKRTVITPLGEDGAIQENPLLIPVDLTTNGIEAKETSKVLEVMGSCCTQKVAFGAKEVTGSLGGPLTTALAMVIAQHLMGKFDTVVNATSDAWEKDTVVAEGDIVNHSDGKHSLVSTKGGTTGGAEPTITSNGQTVTDNSAKWLIVPLLKKGVISSSKKPRAIAVENEFVKDDGSSMFIRYQGIYISKNSLLAKNGEIEMLWTVEVVGAGVEDSFDDGFVALKDMTNAKEVKVFDDLFTTDESRSGYISYKDGEVLCDYEELGFDVTRKVEKSTSVPSYSDGKFTTSPPNIGNSVKAEAGKLVAFATEKLYQEFKNHEKFDADIQMVNGMGGSVKWSFKGILPSYANISVESCLDSKISPELFVTGDCDTESPVSVEVIYPSLVDTTGKIITGDYPV